MYGHALHHNDVIMGATVSQITRLTIVYSTVYSGADQRKHQSSVSLAFVLGIHRLPVQSTINPENASIWWRHYGLVVDSDGNSCNVIHSFDIYEQNPWMCFSVVCRHLGDKNDELG